LNELPFGDVHVDHLGEIKPHRDRLVINDICWWHVTVRGVRVIGLQASTGVENNGCLGGRAGIAREENARLERFIEQLVIRRGECWARRGR
jgi:hypothetical protein